MRMTMTVTPGNCCMVGKVEIPKCFWLAHGRVHYYTLQFQLVRLLSARKLRRSGDTGSSGIGRTPRTNGKTNSKRRFSEECSPHSSASIGLRGRSLTRLEAADANLSFPLCTMSLILAPHIHTSTNGLSSSLPSMDGFREMKR
ncbi:hypothetical protein M404DRAFT_701578 [Pisolithus tinctorius Marx 270]|uniref:Uncharacterized protein n=1 Tax=Pisolithus tinctorius Marx 270 TaxID=870435 RepID=A0A0C3KTR8_PISTI|nr:hypothetical protein M404DRAFT_701578 [Pisolithus tinctorius Marx 270]